MKCSLKPGKKKDKKKAADRTVCEGHFAKDREERRKELQRRFEEVYTDKRETKEVQESRIEYFKNKGNQQFTEDGRNAEVTVDLVLQARVKLGEDPKTRSRAR